MLGHNRWGDWSSVFFFQGTSGVQSLGFLYISNLYSLAEYEKSNSKAHSLNRLSCSGSINLSGATSKEVGRLHRNSTG